GLEQVDAPVEDARAGFTRAEFTRIRVVRATPPLDLVAARKELGRQVASEESRRSEEQDAHRARWIYHAARRAASARSRARDQAGTAGSSTRHSKRPSPFVPSVAAPPCPSTIAIAAARLLGPSP